MIKFTSLEAHDADKSRHLFKAWGWKDTDNPDEADVIIFNGGSDIGTEIYNENPVWQGIPYFKSTRDMLEISIYKEYAKLPSKLKLGICRGAQLLNCLNGGTLWQHVNNHNSDHKMIDLLTGRIIEVTSVHHQQMRPNMATAQILGVSSEATNKHAQDVHEICRLSDDLKRGEDVEVVWYPDTRTLCVQGHPEYVPGSIFANYVKDLIKERMAA